MRPDSIFSMTATVRAQRTAERQVSTRLPAHLIPGGFLTWAVAVPEMKARRFL